MKASVVACANLALIKYWGNMFEELNIPLNDSISVSLESLQSTTTLEFADDHRDTLELNGEEVRGEGMERFLFVLRHFRALSGVTTPVHVASENNFPTAAGIASSASGFGALAHALYAASGVEADLAKISALARLGSGSAARTPIAGYAHWHRGADHESSYATQVRPANDMRILVTITSTEEKPISSSRAMKRSKASSPFFVQRGNTANDRVPFLLKALKEWEFPTIGEITQREANNLHAVINTTDMGLYYWNRTTIEIVHRIKQLQDEGVKCYYTMDAGPQVKVLVMPSDVGAVKSVLAEITEIEEIIDSGVGFGSQLSDHHLF